MNADHSAFLDTHIVVDAREKVGLPGKQIPSRHFDHLSEWPVTVIGMDSIRAAARLSESATLSFWDALIITSAAQAGAQTLYSEDLNHGQLIHGVRIVNPFR